MLIEEIITYGIAAIFCIGVVMYYLRKQRKQTEQTKAKIAVAKEEGRHEPVSLHPYIDLSSCIGSGACVAACPEKDILGLVNGKAAVINASSCVGHGACFHACPVEAISLRIGTESRGVELPHVNQTFETNIQGIYIAGELGGMGLIKNSVEQGKQAVTNLVDQMSKKDPNAVDLIIVGAGPAGISAALTAKKHHLNFKILEQDTLGGTVYSFPRTKIVMTHPMDLPLYGKVKLYDTSKDELLTIWREALGSNNITIQENTKVEHIIPLKDGSFKVKTQTGEELYTNHVLLAIGRRGTPRKLNVQGENLPKVFYKLLEPEQMKGKNILVVGGGDSAIESAMLLMDHNKVTLSYRKDSFSRIKVDNRTRISEAEAKNKLDIVYNSEVSQINQDEVKLEVIEDGQSRFEHIPNDYVYIFAGGELPSKFLQDAGIEVQKRFGYVVKSHKVD